MSTQEQLDRLTGIVESLAASGVEHNDQIGSLITVAQKHQEEMAASRQRHEEEMAAFERKMDELRRSQAETERLWQAYLRGLPPQ